MESIENKMGGYHMDTEDMIVDLNDLIHVLIVIRERLIHMLQKAENQVIVIYVDD